MNHGRGRGPVVIDTNVYGASLVPGSKLAEVYEPIIVGRPALISFQTAAELRFGALLRRWGRARLLRLDARIAAAQTVHSGPELVLTYARLRASCERSGHALGGASMTPTVGSQPPPSGSTSRSSQTTGYSRTYPVCAWPRRGPEAREASA